MTIVFIDLVNYTGMSERLDPEDLRILQRRYQALTTRVMERFGGFVAQFTGDGILVYFGYPLAREKDADRSFLASLELLQQLPSLDTRTESAVLPPLQVRIGIHTGLVLVASEIVHSGIAELRATGEAVNIAARLQAEAPPGGIIASKDSVDLVAQRFDVRPLGARDIRGLTRRLPVFQVIAAINVQAKALASATALTTMLGRDTAMAQLMGCWQAVLADRSCRVVTITGDAGVGKTRLAQEFWKSIASTDVSLLYAACSEIFANTALYAVSSLLASRAELGASDDPSMRMAKIDMMLDAFGVSQGDDRRLLAGLLGVATGEPDAAGQTPQLLRRRQFDLVLALIRDALEGLPQLLWIEDTHWLDPSSAEMLREIAVRFADRPMLIVMTRRSFPEGYALPAAHTAITLGHLDDDVCAAIAGSIDGAKALPGDLLKRAAIAAEGIPLFVEQLTVALIEDAREMAPQSRNAGGVPLLLAEIMSERLDRRPGGRRVLQAAACIGRSFTPDFLAQLTEMSEAAMLVVLDDLVAAELLVKRRVGDETLFEFRHALIQRIADELMVREQRHETHDRIVGLLSRVGGNAPADLQLLAYHLTAAGRTDEAVAAWLRAGVAAAQASAHVEAVVLLRRGLELVPEINGSGESQSLEIYLQMALMGSLIASEGATAPAVAACCARGLELCQHGVPPAMALPFIFGQFTHTNCRGDNRIAAEMAELFLATAESSSDLSGQVIGHRLRGTMLFAQGHGAEAVAAFERSLAMYSPERDARTTQMFGQSTEVHTKSSLGLLLFLRGKVDRGLAMGLDALRSADRIRHPHSSAIPLIYIGGWMFGFADAFEAQARQAQALIDLADQHQLPVFRALGIGQLGWAHCGLGNVEVGEPLVAQAIETLHSLGWQFALSAFRALHADALRRLGRQAEAQASSDRAADELEVSGCNWFEPEQRRIAALVAGAGSDAPPGMVEVQLLEAADCALALGLPVLERRCLLSIAELGSQDAVAGEAERRLQAMAHLDKLPARIAIALG